MTVDVQKLVPWNWFKREDEEKRQELAKATPGAPLAGTPASFHQLHREIDRLFDQAFSRLSVFDFPDFGHALPGFSGRDGLKPSVDIAETDKDYAIRIEVPGVDEKDIRLELSGDTLTVSGEKKRESEEKDKRWHRIERSYGAFKRVLNLPEDANADKIDAKFKNGVLTITMPRKAIEKPEGVKLIDIKSAA